MIRWIGVSPYWNNGNPIPVPDDYKYLFPLSEEAVHHIQQIRPEGIYCPHDAYERATNRYSLRLSLPPHLSPEWSAVNGAVLKSTHSVSGKGVRVLEDAVIVEEFIPFPQYQQDGFVVDGKISFLPTLQQSWKDDYITSYRKIDDWAIRDAAEETICALGVNNTPFCIEFRKQGNQPIVIEVNIRLGEDTGLPELLGFTPGVSDPQVLEG